MKEKLGMPLEAPFKKSQKFVFYFEFYGKLQEISVTHLTNKSCALSALITCVITAITSFYPKTSRTFLFSKINS